MQRILDSGDKETLLIEYKKLIYELFEGKIDKKLLIMTRTLNDNYDNPQAIPHYVLSQKIEERTG